MITNKKVSTKKIITYLTKAICSIYTGASAPSLIISYLPTNEWYVSILQYKTSYKDKVVKHKCTGPNLTKVLTTVANQFLETNPKSTKVQELRNLFVLDRKEIEKQLEIATRNPWNLDINNCCDEVQIAAINFDEGIFSNILNPSFEVQMAAVNKNADYILDIENPSYEVKLTAIKEDPYIIGDLEDASLSLQLEAINIDPNVISVFKNPDIEVQLAAVKKNGYTLKYIKNPTQYVINVAIENIKNNSYYEE